jgi:hypothetical protein
MGNSIRTDDVATIYSQLRPDCREIRLICLEAGHPTDELQIELSTVSLNDYSNYEALSYAWGDPNDTHAIKLNGQVFQITKNLIEALLRLREPRGGKARVLWADAICINQKDTTERNSQLQLMRDIYEGCAKCIIWLGEEDEASKDALAFVDWMASDKHVLEWRFSKRYLKPL